MNPIRRTEFLRLNERANGRLHEFFKMSQDELKNENKCFLKLSCKYIYIPIFFAPHDFREGVGRTMQYELVIDDTSLYVRPNEDSRGMYWNKRKIFVRVDTENKEVCCE